MWVSFSLAAASAFSHFCCSGLPASCTEHPKQTFQWKTGIFSCKHGKMVENLKGISPPTGKLFPKVNPLSNVPKHVIVTSPRADARTILRKRKVKGHKLDQNFLTFSFHPVSLRGMTDQKKKTCRSLENSQFSTLIAALHKNAYF